MNKGGLEGCGTLMGSVLRKWRTATRCRAAWIRRVHALGPLQLTTRAQRCDLILFFVLHSSCSVICRGEVNDQGALLEVLSAAYGGRRVIVVLRYLFSQSHGPECSLHYSFHSFDDPQGEGEGDSKNRVQNMSRHPGDFWGGGRTLGGLIHISPSPVTFSD
jgi:hypothetical protein